MNSSNQEKVVKTESDVQVQNINPLIMDKREMENLSKENNIASNAMNVAVSHSGTDEKDQGVVVSLRRDVKGEAGVAKNLAYLAYAFGQVSKHINEELFDNELLKKSEVHFYSSVRFARKREANRFAKQINSPSNGYRFYETVREGNGYDVSFRWSGVLDRETRNIELDEMLSAMENFSVVQIATEIAIQTRISNMQQLDPMQGEEENLLRTMIKAYGEEYQGGYIMHKCVFPDMPSLMRLEKELLDSADCMGIVDFKEEDSGCTAYLSIHGNISPDEFVMVALRATQKASECGGTYIGWDAYTFIHDETRPLVVH